jgi:NADPH-dependent 2,4-dienoyl-CoA reductase/sulfur reductase-like enzyme
MDERISAYGSGSLWMTEQGSTVDGELARSALAPDVCVVGAGIAGLAVADALVRDGLDVLVLDRGPVGGGQTARSSAHLASALDDRFYPS